MALSKELISNQLSPDIWAAIHLVFNFYELTWCSSYGESVQSLPMASFWYTRSSLTIALVFLETALYEIYMVWTSGGGEAPQCNVAEINHFH